jgi:hypothetical protein
MTDKENSTQDTHAHKFSRKEEGKRKKEKSISEE